MAVTWSRTCGLCHSYVHWKRYIHLPVGERTKARLDRWQRVANVDIVNDCVVVKESRPRCTDWVNKQGLGNVPKPALVPRSVHGS